MDFQDYFPIWNKLTALQQNRILGSLISRKAEKGTIIHNGSMDCTGLLLIKSGLLRAYILSDEGREITIYRLFEQDMCLFSASCIMRSIQFEITIEAEKDTELWVIPAEIYKSIMEESAIEDSNELKITHEIIANHLGSHREVITRMLRYFQSEGMVRLSRGTIVLLDRKKLEALQLNA